MHGGLRLAGLTAEDSLTPFSSQTAGTPKNLKKGSCGRLGGAFRSRYCARRKFHLDTSHSRDYIISESHAFVKRVAKIFIGFGAVPS